MRRPPLPALSALLLLLPALAAAQQPSARKSAVRKPLGEQVSELRATVEQQQRTLERLLQKLDALEQARALQAEATRAAQSQAAAAQQLAQESSSKAEAAQQAAGHAEFSAAEGKTAAILAREHAEKNSGLTAGHNGRFYVRSAGGDFELVPYGYLQLDFRSYAGEQTPANTFLLRRGRFGLQGKLWKVWQYSLLADFVDRNSSLLREGSLNLNHVPWLQLKFGQFKEPFSQEELLTATNIDFAERSPVVNLVPAYSPGVMVHGSVANGILEYQLGAFNGKGFLNLNDTSTPEAVARVRFYPWKAGKRDWLKGLGFGGAIADGRSGLARSFSGLVPTRTFTFFPARDVRGEVLRANGEFTWTVGPAALRGEYVQTNQARDGLGPGGSNLPSVIARAFYVSGTYLLTGEKRPENGAPTPHSEFLSPKSRGIGAWELKFRYAGAQMDDSDAHGRTDQFNTGFNWYPNSYVRYLFDFNIERLRDPVTSPVALQPQTFFSIVSRVQFKF